MRWQDITMPGDTTFTLQTQRWLNSEGTTRDNFLSLCSDGEIKESRRGTFEWKV